MVEDCIELQWQFSNNQENWMTKWLTSFVRSRSALIWLLADIPIIVITKPISVNNPLR